VVQGGVEDCDRVAHEVDSVAVDGGTDQACAGRGLQAGVLVGNAAGVQGDGAIVAVRAIRMPKWLAK
jgi:hypothetical protein